MHIERLMEPSFVQRRIDPFSIDSKLSQKFWHPATMWARGKGGQIPGIIIYALCIT